MNLWQPIATAPVNGANILAWDGDCHTVVWWNPDELLWTDGSIAYVEGTFTHWMPLPEPPLPNLRPEDPLGQPLPPTAPHS